MTLDKLICGDPLSRSSWARGLKQADPSPVRKSGWSRSSWARGLKRRRAETRLLRARLSRSSWARGLKRGATTRSSAPWRVALFVGAWIETSSVPPRRLASQASRSSWARGLKPAWQQGSAIADLVALFVGAWIETTHLNGCRDCSRVALFVGAWIETIVRTVSRGVSAVALFVGAWIETPSSCSKALSRRMSRSSWARGLKQHRRHRLRQLERGRALRGRVD